MVFNKFKGVGMITSKYSKFYTLQPLLATLLSIIIIAAMFVWKPSSSSSNTFSWSIMLCVWCALAVYSIYTLRKRIHEPTSISVSNKGIVFTYRASSIDITWADISEVTIIFKSLGLEALNITTKDNQNPIILYNYMSNFDQLKNEIHKYKVIPGIPITK